MRWSRSFRRRRLTWAALRSWWDDRDGRVVYYDVNALSNFVADARRVIGFDPHERLVDYLTAEAR